METLADMVSKGVVCCEAATAGGSVLSFNPFNAVVQCHACGRTYRPLFHCGARLQGTAGGNNPADCDWPVCGCDAYATKVLEALQESGKL